MTSPISDPTFSLPRLWKPKEACAEPERTFAAPAAVTDEELIDRLKEKDKEALVLLFDRYAKKVKAVARRVLRDPGEAEDLVQSVFLDLYHKSNTFDPNRGTAKSWITQVAYRRALDRRAYLVHRQFYLGTEFLIPAETLAGGIDLERTVASTLVREEMLAVLEELPEAQRQTLILAFFEGLSPQEIGERLGFSVGNVRHHYYRGLTRLRRHPTVRRLWGTP